ncbi:unnamed protein product [Meloidogyne enterolobii]|uniref:Uncharacterized protein n=1 Tax=Meloidogyne enterolobii TaxID=390850 RepID=A0ACB0Z346_MELEN
MIAFRTFYLFDFFLIPLSHLVILSRFFIFFCVLYFSVYFLYSPDNAIAFSSRRTSKIKKFIFFVYWDTRPIF